VKSFFSKDIFFALESFNTVSFSNSIIKGQWRQVATNSVMYLMNFLFMFRQLKTSAWENFPKTSTRNNHKCTTASWIATSAQPCAWMTCKSRGGLMSCSGSAAYSRVRKFPMRCDFSIRESISWQPIKYCRTVRHPPKHKIKVRLCMQPHFRSSDFFRKICRRAVSGHGPVRATGSCDCGVRSHGGTSDKHKCDRKHERKQE